MNGKSRIVVITIVFITLGVTTTMGIATAQDNSTSQNTENNDTVVMQVDSDLVLKDYSFNGDSVTLTLVAQNSQRMKLTDMFGGANSEGASRVTTRTVRLAEGENEIEFDVTTFKSWKGVSIATTDATIRVTNEGTGGQIFTEQYSGETTAMMGLIGAIFGVTVVAVASFKREHEISSNIERYL